MPNYPQDSPLSITSSVAGILTFITAILGTIYLRFTYLRNASSEYFHVKTSLSWYKTESTFISELVASSSSSSSREREYEMYRFVLEQLGKLEERLLELVEETEMKAGVPEEGDEKKGRRWTLVPEGWRTKADIAMAWLRIRAKALDLMKQREALGSRVLFAQMSMMSSRVRDQEEGEKKREYGQKERYERLESMVYAQHEKLDRLENLVYRVMHRDRLASEGMDPSDSLHYEASLDLKNSSGTATPVGTDITTQSEGADELLRKPGIAAFYDSVPVASTPK